MRKTIYSSFDGTASAGRTTLRRMLTALAFGVMVGTTPAQQLIYQEGFNDDGEAANPKRTE